MSIKDSRAELVDILTKITEDLRFGVFLYDVSAKDMLSIEHGEAKGRVVPEGIQSYLFDSKIYCTYISYDEDVLVLYFIRVKIGDDRFVIILYDNKRHSRINRFLEVLFLHIMNISQVDKCDLSISKDAIEDSIRHDEDSISDSEDGQEVGLADNVAFMQLQAKCNDLEKRLSDMVEEHVLNEGVWEQERAEYKKVIANLGVKSFNAAGGAADSGSKWGFDENEVAAADALANRGDFKLDADAVASLSSGEKLVAMSAANIDPSPFGLTKAELDKLKEDVTRLQVIQAQLDGARLHIKDKNDELAVLRAEVEQAKLRNTFVDLEPSGKSMTLNELQDRIRTLESHSLQLQLKITEKEQQISMYKDSNPAALESLRDENVKLKDRARELEIEVERTDAERGRALADIEEKYKKQLAELDSKLLAEKDSFTSKIDELSKTVASKEAEILKIAADSELSLDETNKVYDMGISEVRSEFEKTIAELESKHKSDMDILQVEKDEMIRAMDEKLTAIGGELTEKQRLYSEAESAIALKDIELGECKDVLEVRDRELAEIKGQISEYEQLMQAKESAISDMGQKVAGTNEQVDGLVEEIARLQNEISELETGNHDYQIKVEELEQSNALGSKMLSGITLPIFNIDNTGKLLSFNSAMSFFCNKPVLSLESMTLAEALSDSSNKDGIAELIGDVVHSKEPKEVNFKTKSITGVTDYALTIFPVMDDMQNVQELSGFIENRTQLADALNTVDILRSRMQGFRDRIDTATAKFEAAERESNSMRVELNTLTGKNSQMLKVIERLMSEDKAKELIYTRKELVEVKNKLARASEMVKNYQFRLDDHQLRYSDLNKRAYMQMERLFNVLKTKAQIRGDEALSIMTLLVKELNFVKHNFIDEHKNESLSVAPEDNAMDEAAKLYKSGADDSASVKSIEEAKLKEKLKNARNMRK